MAMEDFRVDVIVGKGPGATAIPLELPPFTLVGATTRAGLLPPPLRDRFGFTAHMEFYEPAELERVIHRSAHLLDVEIDADGAAEIAGRSRGTPRIANRLLRRVRDYAQVKADGVITRDIAAAALEGLRGRRAAASTASTAASWRPCSSCSAAARSACPRSRSRWGRSARPSRRWPSPSSSARDCSPAPPAAGSPPPPHGRISASPRPARRPQETDNRTCSGRDGDRDGAGIGRVRNPGAMLSVVHMRADSLRLRRCRLCRRQTYPQPSGRSPSRSCEGSTDP